MSSLEGQFLYNIPADIMCRFCEVIATLEDSDWAKFASRIVQDVTRLRLLERESRHSRTENLMWYWANKNALVGELLRILNELKLLRARDIILSWSPDPQMRPPRDEHYYPWAFKPYPPGPPDPGPPPKPTPDQRNTGVSAKNPSTEQTQVLKSSGCSLKSLPSPCSPPESLLHSSIAGSTCSGGVSVSSSSHQARSQEEALFSSVSVLETTKPLVWTLQELTAGTKNFCQSQMIGEGGFGHVYKATMRNTDYAIKKLKKDSELEWSTVKQSFLTEVEKLSGLRHPNIIDLAGYCMEEDVYCLVYLYQPNGSLEGRLHGQGDGKVLSWQQRLAILLGVARALQFLHLSQPSLIHGDVKSSNILLDEQLTPKLGDFGLARFRLAQANTGQRSTAMWTKMVRGTLAYLPDEYVKMGKLTLELDTYSFGVVLLENITGKNAIQNEGSGKTKFLKDVVREEEAKDQEEVEALQKRDPSYSVPRNSKAVRTGARIYREHLDHRAGRCPEEVGVDLCQLACQCLDSQKKRPKMVEVYERLKRLHDLLCHLPAGKDSSSLQDVADNSSKELTPPVASLCNSVKDMLLTPEENTFKYSPGWPGCDLTNNQPVALPSKEPLSRTTGSSDSQRHVANDTSQFIRVHPPKEHAGHGNRPRIGQPVNPPKLDSSFGITLGGQCLRTLPNDLNQPVESDESLSDACLSLSSRYQQQASPLSHDSGQGRSLSPTGCKASTVRRHSGGTSVDCQQHRRSSLPGQGRCCCQLAAEQEVALCRSRAETLNTKDSLLPFSGASQNGPPREIIMNPAKERIVQQLALYEQGTINSLELLYSGPNAGLPSVPRGLRTPEESDEFNC